MHPVTFTAKLLLFFSLVLSAESPALSFKTIGPDTLPAKVTLHFHPDFNWDFVTHEKGSVIGKYNCFQLQTNGPKIALGKNIENLLLYLQKNKKSARMIKRARRNIHLQKFAVALALSGIILSAVLFRFTPLLLLSLALFLAAMIAWFFFAKQSQKCLVKAVKHFNNENGYGMVCE